MDCRSSMSFFFLPSFFWWTFPIIHRPQNTIYHFIWIRTTFIDLALKRYDKMMGNDILQTANFYCDADDFMSYWTHSNWNERVGERMLWREMGTMRWGKQKLEKWKWTQKKETCEEQPRENRFRISDETEIHDTSISRNRWGMKWLDVNTFAEKKSMRRKKKYIINLQIIYCGLEFIVHTSFYVGMNRKYSFITHILINEHVFGERNKQNGTEYGTFGKHSKICV